jgi:hypothetical protein
MRIASNSNLPHGYLDVMDRNHSLNECNVINDSLPIKYWEWKGGRGLVAVLLFSCASELYIFDE